MTLTEFLRARIAEDREFAPAPYNHWTNCLAPGGHECTCIATLGKRNRRRLAEFEAKQKLITYSAFMLQAWEDKHAGRESAYPDMTRRERHSARLTLQVLALPYADHPDYDESWRP